MRNIFNRRRYLKIVEIRADEDVASIFGCWFEGEIDRDACMQPNAGDIYRFCQCGLFHWVRVSRFSITISVPLAIM